MLTRKQRELLVFIDAWIKANGLPPSFDEMRVGLNLASKSGIHRLITSLEERGYIRRLAHRARALEVLRLPDGQTHKSEDWIMREKTRTIHDMTVEIQQWRVLCGQQDREIARLRMMLARSGVAA